MAKDIPTHICTECGYRFDAATEIDSDRTPEKGCISLCIECGHLMIFNEDLTLRELEPEELGIRLHPQIIQAQILIRGH